MNSQRNEYFNNYEYYILDWFAPLKNIERLKMIVINPRVFIIASFHLCIRYYFNSYIHMTYDLYIIEEYLFFQRTQPNDFLLPLDRNCCPKYYDDLWMFVIWITGRGPSCGGLDRFVGSCTMSACVCSALADDIRGGARRSAETSYWHEHNTHFILLFTLTHLCIYHLSVY